jgi:hypothetical protein
MHGQVDNRGRAAWRGLACAGNAHAGVETLAPESADTAGVATPVAIDLPAMPTPTQLSALSEDPITVAARAADPIVADNVAENVSGKAVESIAEAPARE